MMNSLEFADTKAAVKAAIEQAFPLTSFGDRLDDLTGEIVAIVQRKGQPR